MVEKKIEKKGCERKEENREGWALVEDN